MDALELLIQRQSARMVKNSLVYPELRRPELVSEVSLPGCVKSAKSAKGVQGPMPWRALLGGLADSGEHEARERWGLRANELIDQGHDWQEAERQAFEELQAGTLPDIPQRFIEHRDLQAESHAFPDERKGPAPKPVTPKAKNLKLSMGKG